MSAELTDRQEQILRVLVDQYVASAHPVGSAAIVACAHLDVSPATVRNEMAVLEEMGFIRHLHTSGGRVPTESGYRYYVEKLMSRDRLTSSEEVTIRHQFHQAHTDLEEWLKLAAMVMASRMHNVGLVTAPKAKKARLRHVEIISTQSNSALLIVVLQDGTVMQEILPLEASLSQEQLSTAADRLNRALSGSTDSEVDSKRKFLGDSDPFFALAVARLMRRGEEQQAHVYHAGLPDLMRQPEFLDPRPGESATMLNERLRQVIDFLQQGFALDSVASSFPAHVTVQVVIGAETPTRGLSDYSFVLGRYGEGGDSKGYLGIVGPTRMEYPRAVALVQYMTDLMTDLIHPY